jgi:hypothetical protein
MPGRRFLYHAHGSAIAGTITKPFKADIDINAATSLPIIGGFASAKSGAYQLNDVISVGSAHTYVSGIQTDDKAHNVVSTCIVEDLNILHMITADAVIGKLSSKHVDGKPPEFSPLGSQFVNLKIGGQPVDVDLDHDLFLRNTTHAALLKHYESLGKGAKGGKAKLRYQWGVDHANVPAGLADGMLMDPSTGWHKSNETLHTSMVKQVRASGSGNSSGELPYAYAIHIPHVGNVYLGEIFVSPDLKRITMLRVELGSPFTGTAAVSSPVGNSGWFPP